MESANIPLNNTEAEVKIESQVSSVKSSRRFSDVWNDFNIVEGQTPSKKPKAVCKHCGKTYSASSTVCRNTIKADCLKLRNKLKEDLKSVLEKIPGRICLTNDLWTSCTNRGYLCLIAYFVDENWMLQSKILNFCHVPPLHTVSALCSIVLALLKEWGIEKKIFSTTLDNARNMDNMQNMLCNKLVQQNALLSHGAFFHIHCCIHILNLIVQDSLKILGRSLDKVKNSVKYVAGSESRVMKFKEYAREYEKVTFPNSVVASSANQDGAHELDDNLMEFETCDSNGEFGSISSFGKTQLELYLSEPRVKLTRALFDVLTFWRVNDYRYPKLAMMARDILSIPITTVASESTFSTGGRVLNKWRSSLTCTNAQVLITTRNWLYGYEAFEDQKDNFEINGEEIDLTKTMRSLSMASKASSSFEEN